MLMVIHIPNLVHSSLDVRYTVFFYNYKFRERDDVGACCNIALGVGCNTGTVEQIASIKVSPTPWRCLFLILVLLISIFQHTTSLD